MAVNHEIFELAFSSCQEMINAISSFRSALFVGPLQASIFLCFCFGFLCYVSALASGYWSWVDRLWSITPVVYIVVFAIYEPCPRLVIMALLSCLWGIRLTFNFWRKGGYGEEEDYRWLVLRKWFLKNDPFHPLCQELFQLLFVAIYQHLLLWLIAAPSAFHVYSFSIKYPNIKQSQELTIYDYLLIFIFMILLCFETLADEQQWNFQSKKHAMSEFEKKKKGGDYLRGFCTSGVFKYSRHLNFFCEQSIWWTIYGFSIIPSIFLNNLQEEFFISHMINISIIGPILLSMLFIGSTTMTEKLSIDKYPIYEVYQQTTSMLIPWFNGIGLDSKEGQAMIIALTAKQAQTTPSNKKDM